MAEAPKIALVGPRAVGKSTVGRWIASRRRAEFVDADDELARVRGFASAGALLAAVGESEFRSHEERVSGRLLESSAGILALGGGAVLSERIRARLARPDWFVAYLTADDATLVARLRSDPTARPKLTSSPLDVEVAALHAERRPRYRAVADVEVAIDGLTVADIGRRVLDAFDLAGHG